MKKSTVILVVPKHNMRKEFSVDHAERILRIQNPNGWQLPANSKYAFDLSTGLYLKKSDKTEESTTD